MVIEDILYKINEFLENENITMDDLEDYSLIIDVNEKYGYVDKCHIEIDKDNSEIICTLTVYD